MARQKLNREPLEQKIIEYIQKGRHPLEVFADRDYYLSGADETWNEAYKMICSGLYMTEEQFKMASPEVQKFFGNVRQVKELAQTHVEVVNTVTKGQFLKQYDVLIDREKEQKLLPQNMQDFIGQLADKMSVKQLGE